MTKVFISVKNFGNLFPYTFIRGANNFFGKLTPFSPNEILSNFKKIHITNLTCGKDLNLDRCHTNICLKEHS